MTPLRRRMIQDMQLRNFAPRTIIVYVNCVVRFARHFGRSPELLGPDDVRAYLLDMIEKQRQSWAYYNLNLQALRFLYNVTMGRPEVLAHLPSPQAPQVSPRRSQPRGSDPLLRRRRAAQSPRPADHGLRRRAPGF